MATSQTGSCLAMSQAIGTVVLLLLSPTLANSTVPKGQVAEDIVADNACRCRCLSLQICWSGKQLPQWATRPMTSPHARGCRAVADEKGRALAGCLYCPGVEQPGAGPPRQLPLLGRCPSRLSGPPGRRCGLAGSRLRRAGRTVGRACRPRESDAPATQAFLFWIAVRRSMF